MLNIRCSPPSQIPQPTGICIGFQVSWEPDYILQQSAVTHELLSFAVQIPK